MNKTIVATSVKEAYRDSFVAATAKAITKLTKAKNQQDFANQCITDVEWGYDTQFTPTADKMADTMLVETLAMYTNLTIGECRKVVANAREIAGEVQVKVDYEPSVSLMGIYKAIAQAVGYTEEETEADLAYDCREVYVSSDIQQKFFDANTEAGVLKAEIGMRWCFAGPKADENLPEGTAKLSHGFFIPREEVKS